MNSVLTGNESDLLPQSESSSQCSWTETKWAEAEAVLKHASHYTLRNAVEYFLQIPKNYVDSLSKLECIVLPGSKVQLTDELSSLVTWHRPSPDVMDWPCGSKGGASCRTLGKWE